MGIEMAWQTMGRSRLLAGSLVALSLFGIIGRASGQGYLCAEGGGSVSRGEWSGPVFSWMVDRAKPLAEKEGAGVRVVVIGSREVGLPLDPEEVDPSEPPDPTSACFRDAGASEVTQFWVNSTNANDDKIAAIIGAAHIVWMRGGSQTRYVQYWKGTPIESAIRAVFDRGGVVGGTSAGCAVLGEFIYDAADGSCPPMEALRNPYADTISFTTDFLRLTPGVIFDSHFAERARFTRLAVFLGRIHADHDRRIVGIGLDARTALCVSPDGRARVLGTGAATVMRMTADTRLHIARGIAPSITDLATDQYVAGEEFDLRAIVADMARVAPQSLMQPEIIRQVDPLDRPHARGDAPLHTSRGSVRIAPNQAENAVFEGTLELTDGEGLFTDGLVVVRALGAPSARQNAAGGICWAMGAGRARWGVLLDNASAVMLDPDGVVRAYLPFGRLGAPMSAAVIAATEEFSPGARAPTARQVASFRGARTHILADRWGFDIRTGRGVDPAAAGPVERISPPPATTVDAPTQAVP